MKRMLNQQGRLTALLIVFVFSSWDVGLANDKAGKIDTFLTQCFDQWQFNGTALVAEEGQIVYSKGFGDANMEWDISNTVDGKFRIGSVTKQFTAMLTMQLVEDGKISLDAKITDYLKDYRKDTDYHSPSVDPYFRDSQLYGHPGILVGLNAQPLFD